MKYGCKNMKLYHLTPKELYDEHIKQEGLVPQPIDPGYAPGDVPENAIFCWPVYTKQLIKDWILFSKVKTENKYDEYILLEVEVTKRSIFDKFDYHHCLDISSSGSRGKNAYQAHSAPCRLVITPISPDKIKPIMNIGTFAAEAVE